MYSADVYSFAITLFCLVSREKPMSHIQFETKEAFLKAVMPPQNLRPQMTHADFSPAMKKLIQWAWDDKPGLRPSMSEIVDKLSTILIAAAIPDECAALVWSRCSGVTVKESLDFDDVFETMVDVLKLKKKRKSECQGAKILKVVCSALEGEVDILKFGRCVAFLGPFDGSFLKRTKALTKHSWFFGEFSTPAAEKCLLAEGNGSFLVRLEAKVSELLLICFFQRFSTSSCPNYTLSYVKDKKIWHTRIKHARETFEIENRVFRSIEEVVKFAIQSKIVVSPASGSPFINLWAKKSNSVGGYKG